MYQPLIHRKAQSQILQGPSARHLRVASRPSKPWLVFVTESPWKDLLETNGTTILPVA